MATLRPTAAALLLISVVELAMPAGAQEGVDVGELIAAALAVGEEEDRIAWAEHAFRRRVLRQRLDAEGAVTWRQEMLFQVTPTADGFDELLLEMDGRQATEAEVQEHREAGRFQKHYEQSNDPVLKNPFGADLPLFPLLYDQEHEYVGLDEANGIPCHRIRWQARDTEKALPWQERLKYAMAGELCVSVEGSHLVHADMQTTRVIKKGPVRANLMRIIFDVSKFGNSWLPIRLESETRAKIPGKEYRTHNIYSYSDYAKP